MSTIPPTGYGSLGMMTSVLVCPDGEGVVRGVARGVALSVYYSPYSLGMMTSVLVCPDGEDVVRGVARGVALSVYYSPYRLWESWYDDQRAGVS